MQTKWRLAGTTITAVCVIGVPVKAESWQMKTRLDAQSSPGNCQVYQSAAYSFDYADGRLSVMANGLREFDRPVSVSEPFTIDWKSATGAALQLTGTVGNRAFRLKNKISGCIWDLL